MRWVAEDQLDRVAATRWSSYGHAGSDLQKFKDGIRDDKRAAPGDFLLAEQNGQALGTATSLSLTMWVRGAAIACQGVAYVGAIKSARRRASGTGNPGVATAVMIETLRMARQRQQVITALMPFRASYYEHFGYGLVERQMKWTIPLSTLPTGDCEGWRLMEPADHPAHAAAWQKQVEGGQCEIERHAGRWERRRVMEQEGMVFIHRPDSGGPIRASAFIAQQTVNERNYLDVREWTADSPASFKGLLCFLSTMRDQFSAARISLPVDWPLNRLLREPQLPHRLVEHAKAEAEMITPLQLRILDHARFLEALHLPAECRGKVNVAVHETEGQVSRFSVEIEAGRASVKLSQATPDFDCLDRHWAAIATGELSATTAVRFGLATQNAPGSAEVLDCLAIGPKPFCQEYF
jgi:predicted acetyltransferase